VGGVVYREAEAQSLLNPVRGMGFRWSANPYRGCTHGCHYCFARRYHTYLELSPGDDFSGVIVVKVNAPRVLRAELARRSWRREVVAVGTATDPYQPIEGRYRLTRGILEALRDARTPASVVTKGPLVVRDIDVLQELRDRAGVTVCLSLTTLDRDRWRQLEPGTAPPAQRLRAVERLARAGISAGVLLAPIIPGLTADRGNLETVVRGAAEHGAAFLGTTLLHLEPGVKEHFTAFLEASAPELLPLYRSLYRATYAPEGVQTRMTARVDELRIRYGLERRPDPLRLPAREAARKSAGEPAQLGLAL
jgi:DNA repair photolyase